MTDTDCREGYPVLAVAEALGVTPASLRGWIKADYVTVAHKEGKKSLLGPRGVLEALCLGYTSRYLSDEPAQLQNSIMLLTEWIEKQPDDAVERVTRGLGLHLFISGECLTYTTPLSYLENLDHWIPKSVVYVAVPIWALLALLMEDLKESMVLIPLPEESVNEAPRHTPIEVTLAHALLDMADQLDDVQLHAKIEEAIRLISGTQAAGMGDPE